MFNPKNLRPGGGRSKGQLPWATACPSMRVERRKKAKETECRQAGPFCPDLSPGFLFPLPLGSASSPEQGGVSRLECVLVDNRILAGLVPGSVYISLEGSC